ncbi:unnamed protein product [Plutella xylostella]|uniref:(diamondback moth) hypothetical protein n=1 Tax=Plutella xylostella TaxID=51655 RepID=A0A8S4D7F1_PLUXY|nr:unnamed protein product [Plutella xylostella]
MINLKVYYQNVRGLRTKTDTFSRNVGLNDYDVIALTETWLYEGIYDEELFDGRYVVWRRDRDYERTQQERGGGVLLAIKRDLIATGLPDWHSPAEDIWVSVTLRCPITKSEYILNICTLYLCTENLGYSFIDQLQNFCNKLESIVTEHDSHKFILLGDYNMSCIKWVVSEDGIEAASLSRPEVCGVAQPELRVRLFGPGYYGRPDLEPSTSLLVDPDLGERALQLRYQSGDLANGFSIVPSVDPKHECSGWSTGSERAINSSGTCLDIREGGSHHPEATLLVSTVAIRCSG